MEQSSERAPKGPRTIALVGPYLSGKTTLLEALLHEAGAIPRPGKVSERSTIGDSSPAAWAHGMSVEVNAASLSFMGESFTFLDCPGSIEFWSDARNLLPACDAAIVVCEADEKKVPALQLILKALDEMKLPRMLFINKIDRAHGRLEDVLQYLQTASTTPLVLRQLPLWQNGIVTGFIDLALERAFVYREHAGSELIEMPAEAQLSKQEARFAMLERLADYDDALMEQLLTDIEPPRDRIFQDLSQELAQGLITPVLLGSAENGNGILRLLKAIRHEVPEVSVTAKRLGVASGNGAVMQVMKTLNSHHGGKLSLVRVLSGEVGDGMVLKGPRAEDMRVAGVFQLFGSDQRKVPAAAAGETVALGRLEPARTGDTLGTGKEAPRQLVRLEAMPPVYGLSLSVADRKDEVKLTAAVQRLMEEDPSLQFEQVPETHEMVLWGQGEMHLRVALEKLHEKFGVDAQSRPRQIAYRETIRKPVQIRGRHKKQSGGHGQYGDVVIDIKPLPRGTGFDFTDTLTGGAVPRQYVPAVEQGVREYMAQGPLGFPVVDIAVNLADGSFHTVDSSEMAFKLAAKLAMGDGMPNCQPVLLEPVVSVKIHVPSDATARVNQIVTGRRGQLLGFDAREGWPGWDTVEAQMPESETPRLIVELRSASQGVGTFMVEPSHLAELTGKLADQVLLARKSQAA